MDRTAFLKTIALGACALAVGCKDNDSAAAPANVDFTLDLTASANTALASVGGTITQSGVIVIALGSSRYAAFQATCTHEGANLNFNGSTQQFNCPRHGAVFNNSGGGVSGPSGTPLKSYTCTLTGTSLRVKG